MVVRSLLCGLLVGCSAPKKLAYTPGELRTRLAQLAPDSSAEERIVLHHVNNAYVERANKLIGLHTTPSSQARMLLDAVRDPAMFGLRYVPAVSSSASESLHSGEGNCLSLASVVVGLARALGLQAYYVDVSHRVEDVDRTGELMVRTGHVTAIIRTEAGFAALDVGRSLSRFGNWRAIDDIEATAHFYNNRGYDLIFKSQRRGEEIDWTQVKRQFWLATRVLPTFARAWNNLGVAEARLGNDELAIHHYNVAIEHDPNLLSPYNNLGSALLRLGRLDEAEETLRQAFELAPKDATIAYQRGIVLRKLGRIEEAIRILEYVLERPGEQMVQELLDELRESQSK